MTEERDAAAIVRQLEEDIVLGRIHPRERLPEDTLMQRFGAWSDDAKTSGRS